VDKDNAITWKSIDLRSGAVRRLSKSEHLSDDGEVRAKHVATDVILM
jgi:hypothetical protein